MAQGNNSQQPPLRVEVLIENYREARQEGIKLVHSTFTDMAFAVALLGTVISGGVIANEPKLLLLFPFLLGGILLYQSQKLRVNNLITSYMIFLEKEINKEYDVPVMIWNSEFIRKNVSVGRQSTWGQLLMAVGLLVLIVIYAGICYWPYQQNAIFFSTNLSLLYLYFIGCALMLIISGLGVINTLVVTKRYSPEYISNLINAKQISHSGEEDIQKKTQTIAEKKSR